MRKRCQRPDFNTAWGNVLGPPVVSFVQVRFHLASYSGCAVELAYMSPDVCRYASSFSQPLLPPQRCTTIVPDMTKGIPQITETKM